VGPLYMSCPDVAVVQLCREKWKTTGNRCSRVCNGGGNLCTERYEPCSASQTLRFLGHSLTTFGHDTAASVAGIGKELRTRLRKTKPVPVFHRLRPPAGLHRTQ